MGNWKIDCLSIENEYDNQNVNNWNQQSTSKYAEKTSFKFMYLYKGIQSKPIFTISLQMSSSVSLRMSQIYISLNTK